MKVDVINTKFGDIEVEYSTFTKGFFIKKFPDKMAHINGLNLLTTRDNSFSDFSKLESYVKDLVHNAMIDFEFSRKVIIYKIESSSYSDGLSFIYLVCDESTKSQSYSGKQNELREYFVHECNIDKYVGKRNTFGQVLYEQASNYVFIDYDEDTHKFFKDFTSSFHILKKTLIDFFDKDKVVYNILNSKSDLKMLGD